MYPFCCIDIYMYKKALFIFRRDLRTGDNTALIAASQQARSIIPLFIADPEQISEKNSYRSQRSMQFMLESLVDLDRELQQNVCRLRIARGAPAEVIATYQRKHSIDAVYCNRDYTPFATRRDSTIEQRCMEQGIAFHSYDDILLHAPSTVVKKDGTPYTMFTPFYRAAQRIEIARPQTTPAVPWDRGSVDYAETIESLMHEIVPSPERLFRHGGRTACTELLKRIAVAQYGTTRDIPSHNSTTQLSAYLKYTVYSPREIFSILKDTHQAPEALLRQLFWRDFFTHIAFFFPHVFGHPFHQEYDAADWRENTTLLQRWREGSTGFPIVDAGMRQLQATGWMHNRARLITASFLTKDLNIDWRIGEQYFAQQLIDYDPAVNNGNWQWVAGTGCDAQPYFRIFNPWLQQKKFDPDAAYIKTWIPELAKVPAATIHAWHQPGVRPENHPYPKAIIDHSQEAERARARMRSMRTKE